MEQYKVVSDQSVLIGETAYNQHDVVSADPTSEQVHALVENGQIEVFTPSAEEVIVETPEGETVEPVANVPEEATADETPEEATV